MEQLLAAGIDDSALALGPQDPYRTGDAATFAVWRTAVARASLILGASTHEIVATLYDTFAKDPTAEWPRPWRAWVVVAAELGAIALLVVAIIPLSAAWFSMSSPGTGGGLAGAGTSHAVAASPAPPVPQSSPTSAAPSPDPLHAFTAPSSHAAEPVTPAPSDTPRATVSESPATATPRDPLPTTSPVPLAVRTSQPSTPQATARVTPVPRASIRPAPTPDAFKLLAAMIPSGVSGRCESVHGAVHLDALATVRCRPAGSSLSLSYFLFADNAALHTAFEMEVAAATQSGGRPCGAGDSRDLSYRRPNENGSHGLASCHDRRDGRSVAVWTQDGTSVLARAASQRLSAQNLARRWRSGAWDTIGDQT